MKKAISDMITDYEIHKGLAAEIMAEDMDIILKKLPRLLDSDSENLAKLVRCILSEIEMSELTGELLKWDWEEAREQLTADLKYIESFDKKEEDAQGNAIDQQTDLLMEGEF